MGFFFGRKEREPHKLPCRQRSNYLSPAEQTLYRILRLAVSDTFSICPRVKLRDIFYIEQPNKNSDLDNQVEQRQITFLLCDIASMKPEVGLELDETPPDQHEKSEEAFLVEEIFEAAGLPFVRIYTASTYNPNDLRERIFEAVSTGDEKDEAAGPAQETEQEGYTGNSKREELEDEAARENMQAPEDDFGGPGDERQESGVDIEMDGAAQPPGKPSPQRFLFGTAAAREEPASQGEQAAGAGSREQEYAGSPEGDFMIQAKPERETNGEGQEPTAGDLDRDDRAGSGNTGTKNPPAFGKDRKEPGSYVSPFEQEFQRKMEEAAAAASERTAPLCPNCQVSMVLCTSKRNTKFYSCANFPRCKEFKGLLE